MAANLRAKQRGDYLDFDEGYGLVDLYADGSFDQQYVVYGWNPPA